jgi:broad specificity phosphatase PhoE
MSRFVWIITHADVVIDPQVPVPDWGLNPRGAARHAALAGTWNRTRPAPDAVWSAPSARRATAPRILAGAFGLTARTDADLGENDRSATGFIPEPEFSGVADSSSPIRTRAFAAGNARATRRRGSWRRWRVVAKTQGTGEIAIVTHGAVSTLLALRAARSSDRRNLGPGIAGGGGICAVDGTGLRRGWRAIEAEDALGP